MGNKVEGTMSTEGRTLERDCNNLEKDVIVIVYDSKNGGWQLPVRSIKKVGAIRLGD